jgi:hypothetical protein
MLDFAPVHAGFTGGDAAKVSPASFQSTLHAVAVIVNGGRPASYTGDGSVFPDGGVLWKTSEFGSIAYCQSPAASNS